MIDDKEKTRVYHFAQTVLKPRYADEQIESILRAIAAHFTAIATDVPQLKAPSSKMTFKIGAGVVAFYRSLPADLPEETKRELVRQFVDEYMKGQFETPAAQFV